MEWSFFVFFKNNWNGLQFNTLSMFQSNWSKFHCISFQYFSHGRWSGLFLFFRKQLKWSTIQYTTFTTTLGFIGLFGQYIAVPILSGWLRLHDSTISLIDAVTRYVSLFLGLFTKKVCLQHKTEKIYKVHPYLLDGTRYSSN